MKKKTYLTIISCLILSSLHGQTLFSDSFSGTTLNPSWIVVNPNPAGIIQLNGNGELLMKASALNGGSDLWPGTNYNAPRILQRPESCAAP